MNKNYTCAISYGKLRVPVYRVYARPLSGFAAIPESYFTGRSNTIFACEIDVEVFGNNFFPAYTQGDNSNVVATDSMKNFVLRQALTFEGATYETFLAMLGKNFLSTYSQMEELHLTARELPFQSVPIPGEHNDTWEESKLLFQRSHNDLAVAQMNFARDGATPIVTSHQSGRLNMELLKVTGSAFTRFVQDQYTTLPERVDRPLFIDLNVYWSYTDVATLLAPGHEQYVPAEQVRDFVQVVFATFVSESIQHLVYEMGLRLLERFPQLATVSFEAHNRTRDLVATSESDDNVKVYTDPFSAYGNITLTIKRDEHSASKSGN